MRYPELPKGPQKVQGHAVGIGGTYKAVIACLPGAEGVYSSYIVISGSLYHISDFHPANKAYHGGLQVSRCCVRNLRAGFSSECMY